MFMPFLIPLLLFFIFYDYNLNSVAWCYLLLVVLIFLIALIFQLFYIVLEDNFFVIKNGICPFLYEKHFYNTYSGAYPFTFRQPIKHKIAFKSTILYPFIP